MKENGFEFKKENDPFKGDMVSINLFDNYKKIKMSFMHSYDNLNYFANLIYRDRNSIFVKDKKTGKWYGTPYNLFYEATHYATTKKIPFNVLNFFLDFYEVAQRGNGYVMGNIREWDKLAVKGLEYLMPFILKRDIHNKIYVQVDYNLEFYTCFFELKSVRVENLKGYLKYCKVLQYVYRSTDDDKKQLAELYPDFCLTIFTKWVRQQHSHTPDHTDYFGPEDMKLMPETTYNQFPLTMDPFMKFKTINRQYCWWLESHSYFIFYRVDLYDFPNKQTLDDCERLFDKNVLPIKKLVKDIGDLDKITIKETKFFIYMTIPISIQTHFFYRTQ